MFFHLFWLSLISLNNIPLFVKLKKIVSLLDLFLSILFFVDVKNQIISLIHLHCASCWYIGICWVFIYSFNIPATLLSLLFLVIVSGCHKIFCVQDHTFF